MSEIRRSFSGSVFLSSRKHRHTKTSNAVEHIVAPELFSALEHVLAEAMENGVRCVRLIDGSTGRKGGAYIDSDTLNVLLHVFELYQKPDEVYKLATEELTDSEMMDVGDAELIELLRRRA